MIRKRDLYENIAILAGAAFFAYTCMRAYNLSLSFDEAWTYLYHSCGSLKHIFSFEGPVGSNNHLLNTLAIKVLAHFFGNSEFVIRIPALAGHAIYLVSIFNILKMFLKGGRFAVGFLLAASNPFLLDFFSCARGYSIGIGFTAAALYFLLKRIECRDTRKNTGYNAASVAMLTLAVLSNLSFLNVFIAVIAVMFFIEIKGIIRIMFPVVIAALFLMIVYPPSALKAIFQGVAEYGGTAGFWVDTVDSILRYYFYGKGYANIDMIWFTDSVIFISFASAVIILLFNYVNKKMAEPLNRYLLALASILFLIAACIKSQFFFLDIKYPTDRIAIYLVPLYIIFLLILWEYVNGGKNVVCRVLYKGVFCILIFAALVHNMLCLNIGYFHQWRYDASTKDAMGTICKINMQTKEIPGRCRIGINHLFKPSVNYYIMRNRMTWLEPVKLDGLETAREYYYLLRGRGEVPKRLVLKMIKTYEISNAILAEPAK
ncbi:MAG: glycosyltransferase family 39 protein [Candidatus Omnitrophota bacterium]